MKYKTLGRTGVSVSQLCMGTMSFGGDADAAASAALYQACRDAGINFFDTANVYSKGRSEEILGGLIKGHRHDLVLTTKCFGAMGENVNDDINGRGTSRRNVTRSVEDSLRRLQTDRVEVLFLHQFDVLTPIDEQMRALEDLVRAGKILYPALSNYAAWQAQKALSVQEANGWARLQLLQPMYNLVKRQAEVEILPMAEANGIGVISYSPLAGGLLSGKYGSAAQASGRLTSNKMYQVRYGESWVHEVAARYTDFCQAHGLHPVSAAVAWVAAHPAITAPIIGARSVQQLQPSLDAVKVEMTPALRAELGALSRTPPPATDRLEEAATSA